MKKIFAILTVTAICVALNFGLMNDAQAAELTLSNQNETRVQDVMQRYETRVPPNDRRIMPPPPDPRVTPPPPKRYRDDRKTSRRVILPPNGRPAMPQPVQPQPPRR